MKIAIVGATGMVGRKMIEVLEEFNMTKDNDFYLYASKKSAGTKLFVGDKSVKVMELTEQNIKPVDIALFSAGSSVSQKFAKKFAKKGAYVIDNSSAFRRIKSVPLVVPEINANSITTKTKIIANPNCSTIQLVLPLFALDKACPIKRVVVSTYQAVSGAGINGVLDLQNGTTNKFIYPIKDNLIPQIDVFKTNLYTMEEDKVIFETQKILNKKIAITATAVRVPVKNAHSESVNVEFKKRISLEKVKSCLKTTKGITVYDDVQKEKYPMPIIADNTDEIYVGRIRKDNSQKNTYNMFIVADNIRKGAATNAVQIAKYIFKEILK